MTDIPLAELKQLNRIGNAAAQPPMVDTSFGESFERAFDATVESDWSVSGYAGNVVIRDRDDDLRQQIADGTIPPELVEQAQVHRRGLAPYLDLDALAQRINEQEGSRVYPVQAEVDARRKADFEEGQRRLAQDMRLDNGWESTAGMLTGGLVAGAADPGMLAAGVATAGLGVLAGAGRGVYSTYRAAKATERLAELVDAATTVKTLTRWQRATSLAAPAALEGALSEAGLMVANAENRRTLGIDYTPGEVLVNLGFGAGLGAALGGTAGGLGANSYNGMLLARQEDAARVIDEMVIEGGRASEIIGDILTGRRDSQGRIVRQDLPPEVHQPVQQLSTTPWVGDVTWVTHPGNEEAFIRMIQDRLPEPTPAGMRTAAPPASRKDAKRTLPLGTFIEAAYRGLSGRGLVRLLGGKDGWNPLPGDATSDSFTVYSSADRAGTTDGDGAFVVKLNPDALVGRMVYRASDIHKQWEKGDVTFRVRKESRFEAEGRGDNFLADAIDEIRVRDEIAFKQGSADMKKVRKQLRKAGFTMTRENGVTVFRRNRPKPAKREDLQAAQVSLDAAVQKLLDSKEFMAMAPPGVEGLPASYIVARLQGASRRLSGIDLRPVADGRSVADFEAATGAKLGDTSNPKGKPTLAEVDEVNARFAALEKENPDLVNVRMDDDASVDADVRTVHAGRVIAEQQTAIDRLRAAMTSCKIG